MLNRWCTAVAQATASSSRAFESFAMVSAGHYHSVLLRSDGSAVACGAKESGQCDIPPLGEGVKYTQVSAGVSHTVLLRSDGLAVACGNNPDGRCRIPRLHHGVTYTQVSTCVSHTLFLRSDGSAVASGFTLTGGGKIPDLDEGVTYTQVSAGHHHSVLLRSDGSAVACGDNPYGQCDIPPLDDGVFYTQVSAGGFHTVLLRSDGSAVACGDNPYGQCDIPPLDNWPWVTYTQVSAGHYHTVLLRSDGSAVACGDNICGICDIPPLDDGVTYAQVSAGVSHTLFLRSDGSAVVRGDNQYGQCNVPSLLSWREWLGGRPPTLRYIADFKVTARRPGRIDRILQLDFLHEGDALILWCVGMDGEEVARLRTRGSDLAADALDQLTRNGKVCREQHRVVLPDGRLLDAVCSADPSLTLATLFESHHKCLAALPTAGEESARDNLQSIGSTWEGELGSDRWLRRPRAAGLLAQWRQQRALARPAYRAPGGEPDAWWQGRAVTATLKPMVDSGAEWEPKRCEIRSATAEVKTGLLKKLEQQGEWW
eukprot:Skav202568  [mRNA]  locus=scaffold2177:308492:311249:- [translate_table: standard]